MSCRVMNKGFLEYKLYVFDLDGTLYFQKKLRLIMAKRLLIYYGTHFWKFKEPFIIKSFRKVKDNWDEIAKAVDLNSFKADPSDIDELQYEYVGKKLNVPANRVRDVIHKWIYDNPLDAVAITKDVRISQIINDLMAAGKSVVIFSDYPTSDKLKALGIKPDYSYCSSSKEIGELKPSPKGLIYISKQLNIPVKDILMIGDRMEKDGECAKRAGIDYIILGRSQSNRSYDFV